MSSRLRALIGVVTATVFLGIGAALYTEGQALLGGVIFALGVLRAVVAARQVATGFMSGSEDSEDD